MPPTVDLDSLELGISDAARLLKRSPSWLRKMEREQRIPPATRADNGQRGYRLADLEAIARERRDRQPTPPSAA